MSTAIALASSLADGWSREKIDLIKRTCAVDATDDELQMYLHVAKNSGLDPLRKQLHFMKFKGRVSMIADVNGLQERAAEEPDYEGIAHAVVYKGDKFIVDNKTQEVIEHTSNPLGENGPIVGAWASVHRKGMRPFFSVVKFSEYVSPFNDLWKSKPAVMIDKCAKSTALRMAYPKKLGGIFDRAEMDRVVDAEKVSVSTSGVAALKDRLGVQQPEAPKPVAGPTVVWGHHKGRLVTSLSDSELSGLVDEVEAKMPEWEAQYPTYLPNIKRCKDAILAEIESRQSQPIDAEWTSTVELEGAPAETPTP